MSMIPKTSIGIEIAGEDLRLAVLREFAGRRRLVRMDVLAGFLAFSDEDRTIQLATHFRKHKLSNFNVHLTVPGSWGVARDLELPATIGAADAVRSAVALQVENLSPWALDEIYWDSVQKPATKGSRTIIAHIGIVPRAVLDPWIALFRSARLALTGVSLSSLSWAHGVAVFWNTEQPAMIIAAETNYIEAALISDDRLYAINVPGVNGAQSVQASASQLMRTGRIESTDQIRLIAYGSATPQAGLDPTQLPIDTAGDTASAFGAVSTALLGLARSGFRLNLIPAELRHQRNHLQLIPTYALVACLALLGVFALIREPYQQSLYAQQLDNEARRLAVEVKSVADQETRLNQMNDRLKTLDGLVRGRDANLEAMRELSRVLPQGTWLTSYVYQDGVVTLAGFSESAAAIQKLLEDSAVFRDVQFTTSITRDTSGKDRFTLRASIEVRP